VKQMILSLVLACSLLLTGCASMLNRGDLLITPHNETPTAEGDSSTLRVENYQDLVSAIFYFVMQGSEKGTLRLYNYTRDVDADLNAACVEVAQEDPIGAYALDFIKFEFTHIVNYYEVQLDFKYRRTQEQVDSIVSVVGTNAIRQELCDALSEFRSEIALRLGYFAGNQESLYELLREAYYDTPYAAFGIPQATISIYPDSGFQRVVEFQLDYSSTSAQLQVLQSRLRYRAESDTSNLYLQSPEKAFTELTQSLLGRAGYAPEGSSSLQFLLLSLPASSEGLALAIRLYAQELDLACYVVEGTLNGEPHFWNIVRTSSGYRHLDPSVSDSEVEFHSDLMMESLGYQWKTSAFPRCIDPSEHLPTAPPNLPSISPPDPEISPEVFDENT